MAMKQVVTWRTGALIALLAHALLLMSAAFTIAILAAVGKEIDVRVEIDEQIVALLVFAAVIPYVPIFVLYVPTVASRLRVTGFGFKLGPFEVKGELSDEYDETARHLRAAESEVDIMIEGVRHQIGEDL
ncbi:MAG: hypothetical protein IH865_00370 [Chloroflexi bacterium]|nr:hypothetical protein [Chloroflexota bacterium]